MAGDEQNTNQPVNQPGSEGNAGAADNQQSQQQQQVDNQEQKPPDNQPDNEQQQEGEQNEEQVPEEYKFDVPEGMELDKELVESAVPIFKEMGLTQKEAQGLVDVYNKHTQAQSEAIERAFDETVDGWEKQSRADKEFGGAQFEQNLSVAQGPLNRFGTPELIEALKLTGMGNHPEMVRFMYRIGKAMGEDRMPGGGLGNENTPKDPAKVLFPNQN